MLPHQVVLTVLTVVLVSFLTSPLEHSREAIFFARVDCLERALKPRKSVLPRKRWKIMNCLMLKDLIYETIIIPMTSIMNAICLKV